MADDHSLCSRDLIEAAADSCAFARQHCASDAAGLFGSYVPLYYCQLGASPAAFAPLCALLLLLTICCLGSTADLFFIPQLTLLSELLVLPPDVAGITLLAFGNGAPDVFTAVAVANRADFPLLLSDLLGGSVFITTVVLGAVAWYANAPPSVSSRRRTGRTASLDAGDRALCSSQHSRRHDFGPGSLSAHPHLPTPGPRRCCRLRRVGRGRGRWSRSPFGATCAPSPSPSSPSSLPPRAAPSASAPPSSSSSSTSATSPVSSGCRGSAGHARRCSLLV